MIARLFDFRLALLAALGLLLLAAVVGFPQGSGQDRWRGTQLHQDVRTKRVDFFELQRAFPAKKIPFGALQSAQAQLQSALSKGALTQAVTGNGWVSIGPNPLVQGGRNVSGRTNAVAVHPANPNVIYIGAAQGGVWKTTNGGTSWTPLTDAQPSLAMGALALDPNNPSTLYAGLGEANFSLDSYFGAGIVKSTNGGGSWTQLGAGTFTGTSFSRILVDPANSQTIYAGNTWGVAGFGASFPPTIPATGVYKSTDGGTSWGIVLGQAQTGEFFSNVTDLVMDPTNSQVLLAAVNACCGASSGGQLWKSTNGGTSWTQLTSGLPASNTFGRSNLGISADGQTLYAGLAANDGSLAGLFKSTNGGSTWAELPNGTATGYCGFQCWYDNELVVDPANANVVFAGGIFLWRTTDGGASWSDVSTGTNTTIHVDQHALVYDGAGSLLVGNDGGVWKTTNPTAATITWSDLNTNLATLQMYPYGALHPTNRNFMLTGTQDNGCDLYSGTQTWTDIACGDGAAQAVDFSSPDTVWYVSSQTLEIEKTTNGGLSFFDATGGLPRSGTGFGTIIDAPFIANYQMCPNDHLVLIAGTSRVHRTSNGAASWVNNSPVLQPLGCNGNNCGVHGLAFAPSTGDCNTYYVGTDGGKTWKTTDGGSNWSDITQSNLPGRFVTDIVVHPANANVVYVTYSGFNGNTPGTPGHVFKTTNGGTSWTDVSGALPDTPANAIAVDPVDTNTLYVGTDLGVFRTTDGGASWQTFSQGLPNVAVFDLLINTTTDTLRAATHGRGVWELTLSGNPNPTAAAFTVDKAGKVKADGSYNSATGGFNSGSGADLAEGIRSLELLLPGEVVELDPDHPGQFRKSRGGAVVGVVSTRPGMSLASSSQALLEPLDWALELRPASQDFLELAPSSELPLTLSLTLDDALAYWAAWRPLLALAGRVPVWVTDEGGPIRPGDLLTPSLTRTGYATKCSLPCQRPIFGKALQPLVGSEGLIEMLVMRP